MPSFRIAVLVAAGALVAAATQPAHAFVQFGAASGVCELASATDPGGPPGTQRGIVTGVLRQPSRPGMLQCMVYVNTVADPGAEADGHTTGSGAVQWAFAVGFVSYPATEADVVTLCATFQYDAGGTEWWDDGAASWRPMPVDPSRCAQIVESTSPNPDVCPWLNAIDVRFGTSVADLWQDCEPYAPVI